MKKRFVIIMCSVLVLVLLTACGAADSSVQNTEKTEENSQENNGAENEQDMLGADAPEEENQEEIVFDGKVLTVNMDDDDYYMKYVLTITDCKVINPGEEGNEYGESPVIAFWYETAFETGIEEMTAYQSWAWVLNAIQDNNDSVVNELELTSSPDSQLAETEWERIKDGATVKGAIAYKLDDTTTPVQIVGEMNGREVGRGVFELDSLSKEESNASSAEETVTYTISGIAELAGTWETASQGYEYFDTPQAEYYVRFMDSEIVYGHMQDDEFVFDHSDKIVDLEEIAEGRYKVKAETANGGQYTYMTSESSNDLLFYYMTWDEDEFPDQLSGSSSIGRISSEPSAGETIVIPIPASAGAENRV